MMNNQTFNSKIFIFSFCLLLGFPLIGKNILIPMDENNQNNETLMENLPQHPKLCVNESMSNCDIQD